jgi:hypothetical protein
MDLSYDQNMRVAEILFWVGIISVAFGIFIFALLFFNIRIGDGFTNLLIYLLGLAFGGLILPISIYFEQKGLSKRKSHHIELAAPKGMLRVVGINLSSHQEYLVGDYENHEIALKIANNNNEKRGGLMDDIFYVYDDNELLVQNNKATD